MNAARLNRWLHYWLSLAIMLPLALIIGSGLLLVLKKDVSWIQPPTVRGSAKVPETGFDAILAAVQAVPEAGLGQWDDIDRLDLQPGKGMVKVQGKNRWEVQVDIATGEVLQVAYRRSDLIESLHDGTFFGDPAKYWVVLPTGLVLAVMWGTGVYLFVLPFLARRRQRRRRLRQVPAE